MADSFLEELTKIAQETAPVDPKQALKNKLLIAGGTGLGIGLGTATNIGLDRLLRGGAKSLPTWTLPATAVLGGVAGLGSTLAYSKMREQEKKLLEEASKKGEQSE